MSDNEEQRTRVFVSYSHADQRWLERLKTHLTPLWQTYEIDVWDDTRIRPGSRWREEIRSAVENANIAVLIVSVDFLASDFIRTNELPPLLRAAEEEGALILPIIASPSLFLKNPDLSQFQAVNNPSAPLISASEGDREATFVKVAEAVLERVGIVRKQSRNYPTTPQKAASEAFLRPDTWTRLVKIGDWIFDKDADRIIGAGMQAYLLSRSEYGDKPFTIQVSLEFTNIGRSVAGTVGMNAGIILGWKEENQAHRYYNILLTGKELLLERIGFKGGDDFADFEHMTEGAPFVIDPGLPVNLAIAVDHEHVSISSGKNALHSIARPTGIVGRVGLRPWRSKLDCTRFVVSE